MGLREEMSLADKKKALQALKNKTNKEAKRPVLCYSDEAPSPYFLRRPTGIMQLDIDLGGGFPAGGVSYISGPENAGKSWLLYKTFAMNQRLYKQNANIALFSVEGPIDYFRMRQCGYKIAIPQENIEQQQEHRKARGVPPLTKAEVKELATGIGDITLGFPSTMEQLLDITLDFIKSQLFQIIAIDSISAACPSAEAVLASFGEFPQQGAHASLMKRFFQHYFPLSAGLEGINETSLLFTNQVVMNRAKSEAPAYIGKYMKDWKPAGSPAAKHGKLIDVQIWSGAKEKATEKGEKLVVGKSINWDIVKGKAGTHDHITGEFDFYYSDDPVHTNAKSLVYAGLRHGALIERAGKVTLIYPETGVAFPGAENVSSIDNFIDMVRTDFDFEMAVRREVLAAAKLQCTYV